jgi:diguanylate cyclase
MSPSRRTAAIVLVGAVSLALVRTDELVAYFIQTASVVVAGGFLLSGERRRDELRRTRFFLLLALIAAFTSGLSLFVYNLLTGHLPADPWLDDALVLCYPPLTVIGLILIPAADRRTGHRARALADGLIAASSLWYLLMAIDISAGEAGSLLAQTAKVAYPVGDVFVVSTALAVLARCTAEARRIVLLIACGVAALAAADIWFAKNLALGPQDSPGVLFQLGVVLLIVAASSPPVRSRESGADARFAAVLGAAPFAPLVVCMGFTTRMILNGEPMPQRQVLPALVVAVGLMLRAVASSREKERLLKDLRCREQTLEAALRLDELTGLANRVGLIEELDAAVAAERPVSIALLDLDDFKLINDNHGHDVGDEILRVVASRLRHSVRDTDVIARLGGDEFAVIADPYDGLAERLLECFEVPVLVGARRFRLRASIGIVTSRPTDSSAALLAHADAAMYQAKERKQRDSQVEELHGDGRKSVAARLRIREDVAAPTLEQYRVVYQPVVELSTGRIRGIEALLRWDHPEFGAVSPAIFIPLAEQAGSIGVLGEWVLQRAIADLGETRRKCPGNLLTVSVNVSPRQLADEEFIDRTLTLIEANELEPGALVLEITEQALETDLEAIAGAVARLRAAGILVAIDDFGTGYSSLRYLQHLEVDIMKVDRSFVGEITGADSQCLLVSSIAGMGSTLGLTLVAEGIESLDQLRMLQTMQIDLGQGFLFSVPVPIEEIQRLLRSSGAYPVALAHVGGTPDGVPVQRKSAIREWVIGS